MNISVIIPTYNAGTVLEELLAKLSKQKIRPKEIIVIDSSSADNTLEVAQRLGARTITIPKKEFNHGGTRNRAALEATGDTLVFMTQDALPFDDTLLGTLTHPLEDHEIAAAFGRQVPRCDASLLETFARSFNYPNLPYVRGKADISRYGIKTFFFSNVCSAVRKDLFCRVGMFPAGVRANEDMLLAARLIMDGYKISYVPDAVVIHSHRLSLADQFRRYFNIASSLKQNGWVLTYVLPEGEGIKFLKEQTLFVLRHHRYFLVPYIVLESIAKYAGYRIGLMKG